MIAHYALMPPDPVTQAHLVIVTAGDVGALNLSVGGQSVAASSAQIPSRPEFIHHFRVSGLRPGRLHQWSVGEWTGLPLRTLPGGMPPAGIRAVLLSDHHIGTAGRMTNTDEMDLIGGKNPDVALIYGDQVDTSSFSFGSTNGGRWVDVFTNWYPRLSSSFLVPILAVPGNHDVGNGSPWDGVGAVDPDGGYFRVFEPNIADFAPTGTNYGAALLGDYLEVWALDSHSAEAAALGAWLADVEPQGNTVISIMHSPLFAADVRGVGDPGLQANLRNAVGRKVLGTCPVSFGGHIHNRTVTKGLGWYATDPGGDRFVLSEGFIGEAGGGHVQFGNGNSQDRSAPAQWYLEVSTNGAANRHFQVLDLSRTEMRVRSISMSNGVLDDRTWQRPSPRRVQAVSSSGALTTPINRDGAPVYPRGRAA
jgi:hypothetical protein